MSKVFIIGNGFDISLGWNTRYSDFASNNRFWPFRKCIEGLSGHLEKKKNIEKWLDIEKELYEYAKNYPSGTICTVADKMQEQNRIAKDIESYHSLVTTLSLYIKEECDMPIRSSSPAARVFKAIINNGKFEHIFTFNYTNLHIVAQALNLPTVPFDYVHGSLDNNDIIIGIDDHNEVRRGYDFLYKTFNKNYPSNPINYALQESDEVVFFGHSLGETDYHYFKNFFFDQSLSSLSVKDQKYITIFTWDEQSRMQILRQLRNMNEGSLEYLFANNHFQIICTDGKDVKDETKMCAFEQHMKECSLEADASVLEYIL